MNEPTFSSATALADGIRHKQISSVEAVDAHLMQIARVNPELNAVVHVLDEPARRAAREADAAVSRGEDLGRFPGVPMTEAALAGYRRPMLIRATVAA
jgi:amidase